MERARRIAAWFIVIITLATLIFLLTSKVFRLNVVVGDSMAPNYQDGDLLICNRLQRKEFKTGEVIIFKEKDGYKDGYLVKRVVAVGGEAVEIKDNTVYVDSQILSESYVKNEDNMVDMDKETVPKDSLFVMGDNRDKSLDSRSDKVSFVSISQVYGKVIINLSDLGISRDNYTVACLLCVIIVIVSIDFLEKISNRGDIRKNREIINMLLVLTSNKLIRQKNFRTYLIVRGISLEKKMEQFGGSEVGLSQQITLIILGEDISKKIASCKYIGTYLDNLIDESEESIQIGLMGEAHGKREVRQKIINYLSTKS